MLDDGAQQLLTLVSGPAGAGKTTLLAAWMSEGQRPGPAAWLSLDSGDNEPGRFWAHALAALCRSGAVPANSALRSLAPRPGSEKRLSEDDLALLQARTEGWAAGLWLAALSLQNEPDPHRFVAEFAGDDQSMATPTATTSCSLSCSVASRDARSQARSPSCTGGPRTGTPPVDWSSTPSSRRSRRGTGVRRPT
jgi:hypothetical protein